MKKLFGFILTLVFMASFATTDENPFFSDYETPFGVPPFHLIENSHFIPAFEEGVRQQEAEIAAIINNPALPDFDNTVAALDYSGELLNRVASVFYNYNSSNTSDEIQALAQEVAPMMSSHRDNISLNPALFARIQTVYNQKDELGLTEEQAMLLEETYQSFVRNGAALPAEQQERFREINQELSVLTLQFGQNVLADVNGFKLWVDDEADLAGLPGSVVDAAAEAAAADGQEGKWLFTLHNPSVMPFLTYADNRDLREKMNRAYVLRGNNDNDNNNQEIINRLTELRLERSNMLGFDTYADFALQNRMAGNVETVETFLKDLWTAALPIARDEAVELQKMITSEGGDYELAYWDWRYYAEKVRKAKYDLDEGEISQYFEINNVRDGIFMIVNKLWGLEFVERADVPVYHPDATAWEVLEADGSHLGILYMDMHPRASKRGGAWMSSYRRQQVSQDGEFVHPIITIVCNFTAPSGNQPALLTFDEMTTFFHEFGHAIHGLMSDVIYPGLAGTSVPRDFVELPSQVLENWAKHPEVLKMFAKHYETGETIPDELIDRIMASANFNQGFATVEFLASALLDMDYHTKTVFEPFDVNEFESGVQNRYDMMDEIYFRHGSTHFQHIFSGGYSAGYYSYIWAGVLDADAFEAFVETGDLFHQETARKFREEILERGGTRDAMEMYKSFRGKEPGIEPLLRQRGLVR
ncbi:M3 family metallopeptidase [Alkalitalea saponilacus]|uniref:Peptidyl-dipeptidase Dcp n=1 Tax=Alkalitalea saponilacus TaxID=889453 RepID=A0A1T5HEX1_9BACT|nr:M3 family metallopeptidase [Alkalitalea saponilacus]ASB48076.1 peptidase M3 [Alkalitalea saponilacus]SKC19159.1 peptidyl-dipeptidase Dcp [Alkalitalea saponilacus]